MTYDDQETSDDTGEPVELYTFTNGGDLYRYTSSESTETSGVLSFEPVAIQRDDTAEGPEERDYDFAMRLPSSDPVALLFAGLPPIGRVRVRVQRFHRSDTPTPEVQTVFDGYVTGATYDENWRSCKLTARSTFSSIGRQMPARTFQGLCNHRLYGASCKADDTDPAFRASTKSVTSQVDNVLTVAGLGAFAAGWFTGGYVEDAVTGEKRMVLDDDGAGALTLLLPFSAEPSTVNVIAGCDHEAETCQSKFDNLVNFGGFPFVPTANPFDGLD